MKSEHICGAYKLFILSQGNSKIMSNDPKHELSQVAAFVPTDSLDDTILTSFAFTEGINAVQNVQIHPHLNGDQTGIRLYFEVMNPASRISAFQARVGLMQRGASAIGDPQPID